MGLRCGILGLSLVAAIGCSLSRSSAGAASERQTAADGGPQGHLQLLISVDWEGRDLLDANLSAMQTLRDDFPDLKIVHFLNAAYFTKPGADAHDVTSRITRPLRPNDELGLHIHGWERLFQAAGVTFRSAPTFWGTSQLTDDCTYDCGHEVAISAYDTSELRKVISFSIDTLDHAGFGRAKSFRAGGWMATPNVREALAGEGLGWDNSPVPSSLLAARIGTYPLDAWLADLWSGTTSTSQPFAVTTSSGNLVEVPDNGALADYMTSQNMVDVYEACKAAYIADPNRNVIVSIGFHEETAAAFVPTFEDALRRIFAEAKQESIPLEMVTCQSIAPD
jgi:hypothetical protein